MAMNNFYGYDGIPSLIEAGLWKQGMPCAAIYEEDKKWYRAILDDPEYGVVYFVDYGDLGERKPAEIKPMSRTLAEISPPMVLRCSVCAIQDPRIPSFMGSKNEFDVFVLNNREPYEVLISVPNPFSVINNLTETRLEFDPASFNRIDLTPPPDGQKVLTRSTAGIIESISPRRGASVCVQSYQAGKFHIDLRKTKYRGEPLFDVDLTRLIPVRQKIKFSAIKEIVTDADDDDQNDVGSSTASASNPVIGGARKKVRFQLSETRTRRRDDANDDGDGQTTDSNKVRNLVTDFKLADQSVFVIHGIVSFVRENDCVLYIHRRNEYVWASKGVFPARIANSTLPLNQLLPLGHLVLAQVLPSFYFYDIVVRVEWVALAVELVGDVVYTDRMGELGTDQVGLTQSYQYSMSHKQTIVLENLSNEIRMDRSHEEKMAEAKVDEEILIEF